MKSTTHPTIKKRRDFYEEHYEIVELIDATHFEQGKKRRLGDRTEGCRFCGRGSRDTTFRKEAHAFPEFLGNKTFLLEDECDDCNQFFGDYETHLQRLVGLDLTLHRVKGKRGVPTFGIPGSQDRFRWTSQNALRAESRIGDTFIRVDLKNQKIHIEERKQPYIPQLALKSLVKMALSAVAPQELDSDFGEALAWLRNGNGDSGAVSSPFFQVFASRSARARKGISALLLRRRLANANFPLMMMQVQFANRSFQLFVPFCSADRHLRGTLSIPALPTQAEGLMPVMTWIEDLGGRDLVKDRVERRTFPYDGTVDIRDEHGLLAKLLEAWGG